MRFESSGGPSPGRLRVRPLVLVLAAVLLLGFACWLTWRLVGGDDASAHASKTARRHASHEATSGAGGSASPSPSARRSHGSARGGGSSKHGDAALTGRTVVLDPGHNPHNARHLSKIHKQVRMGRGTKECDTTGTSTNSGYSEARFTLDVSRRVRELLRQEGAKVVLTQDGKRPWGPCVNERARIGNEAHADAAVSIHADGSGASSRGFHVINPGSVHTHGADTRKITGPSHTLGGYVKKGFAKHTGSSPANYLGGGDGLVTRTDLGGLNLSRVPKVFLECGNMRNATEARQMKSARWRQHAADGVAAGITKFLTSGSG